MPKRPIYLQSPDDPCQRIRRDLEFLRDYWNRLLGSSQSHDVRLPELLRANHLMRHLSFLPSNHGMRVNVSFTILDDSDYLESEGIHTGTYPIEPHNSGFCRSLCNGNTARHNNLLRNYERQLSENYAAIERELIRARLLASLVERDRFMRCQSALYNQSFNDSPKTIEQHCLQHSPQTFSSCAMVKTLQSNNNAQQNHAETASDRNAKATIKQRSAKESMETCQGVSKIVQDAVKISHSAESPNVKLDGGGGGGGGGAINKSDKRLIDPQLIGCQGSVLQFGESSDVAADQSRHVEGQERGVKRKLDELEDQATAVGRQADVQQNQLRSERIESLFKDTPTIFPLDEKITRNRVRNGRISIDRRPYARRRVSSPKYASFLRMFRKEEADERLRGNSSSRRDEAEKSQRRRGPSTESAGYDNRGIRDGPRIERKVPTPRSTVHTTYNPIIHSTTDPILDSDGLMIQLLRLAVLLYTPALMPALNSLIARQNQQAPVPTSSAFEGSNDLLTQIFRLLNEQQSIPNLPFVSRGTERVSPALAAQTNIGSSRTRSERNEEDTAIAKEEQPAATSRESISAGTNGWRSSSRVQQRNGKDKEWRLTSMLTDSNVRLDGNIFSPEDLRRFEEFLRAEKKRPEDVRSLSTRHKNEIVMKEHFRDWSHRLLQQLNATGSNSNDKEAGRSEGSSRTAGESPSERIEGQRSADRLTPDEPSGSSKEARNSFAEHEEEDSDDRKSLTSATSSSKSLQLKQDDAKEEETRNANSKD